MRSHAPCADALTRRAVGAGVMSLGTLAAGRHLVRPARAAAMPVIVASDEDVSTLDPHLIRNNHPVGSVVWSVFDSLVRRRPDGSHEPRLALRWAQPAPTIWRFALRPGVVFQNGETLDAQAVVENFERMGRSPFNGESQLWQQTGLLSVRAPDPLTVELRTDGPAISMLYWLEEAFIGAPRYLRDTPPEVVGAHPVGSGPYRFVAWQRGDHVALTAYERHWRGAPAIRDVVFRAVPEMSSRIAELRAGSIDLVPGLDPDTAIGVASLQCELKQVLGLRKMHVGISQHGTPALRDPVVRRALNHAVDVPTMIDTLQRGMTRKLASVINPPNNDPGLPGFSYDPDLASDLLRRSGHAGFELELAYDIKFPDAQECCEAIAGYLAAVGVNAQANAYESGRYLETLRARAFPGLYFYGFAALINPLVELSIFTSDAVDNASGYGNKEFDRLVHAASTTSDDGARAQLVRQAERLVWQDCPWIYLWYLPTLYGQSRRLSYQPRPDDYVELYEATLQERA